MFILRRAAPPPELEGCERYLFVGPHPDDIEIGAGATAARFAAEGKQVRFLICTDGRYGTLTAPEGTTPEQLIGIRQSEALAAAETLGVHDVRFLGLSDGGFYSEEELLTLLAREIGEYRPDVIFAPDPDVASECHPDHRSVGRAAARLALFASNPGIMARYGAEATPPVTALAFYMTAKPNRFVAVRGLLERQKAALFSCHKSQFPANGPEASSLSLYLKLRSAFFGLRSGRGAAEGFRVLGQTQMHCFPEAD